MKKVLNIVFYNFYSKKEDVKERQQACIFYDDGTVASVSVEEASAIAHEIAREEKIRTKAELKTKFNNSRIHVMSGAEFERRFQEFMAKPKVPTAEDYKMTQEAYDDYIAEGFTPGTEDFDSAVILDGTGVVPSKTTQPKPAPRTVNSTGKKSEPVSTTKSTYVPVVTPRATKKVVTPTGTVEPIRTTGTITPKVTVSTGGKTSSEPTRKPTPVVVPVINPTPRPTKSTGTTTVDPVATVTPPKKKNIFQRVADKLKKNKVVRNILIGATALAIALAGYSCGARQSQKGEITNPPSIVSTMLEETGDEYITLINQTTNEKQKEAMIHSSYLMDNFNTTFAEHFEDEKQNIKPALTWDEMMALNLAYNDYSKDEIIAMFNGSEIDATELSNAYRNGTLQLMGAYVLADADRPVNSHQFLRNEEEQAFVLKYENLFYACKEADTKEEQIAAVNAFYAEIHKDFPIDEQVREEGISHAEGRRQLKSYKLAVTPMVAAAEMMYQNLDIDHTLSDKAVAYFNDMGLCNLADAEFEKAMYISLAAQTDEENPTYTEFKTTKIDELISEGSYGVSDAERDLSKLELFQFWVNGGFTAETGKTATHTGGTSTTTKTWTETNTTTRTETHTETTNSREEAVSQAGEQKVQQAEDKVDQQIQAENDAAKKEAEKKAEEERKKQQAEADKKKQEQQAAADKHNQGVQNDIDNANDKINQGGTVTEDDFGGNVDFDDEHSQGGVLDDSVKDITTDGTGAVDSNTPLPDPNDLEDDDNYGSNSSSQTYTNTSGQQVYEYEEFVSNEQLVDEYIRSLEAMGQQHREEQGRSK